MAKNKKENPVAVYAVASQIGLIVIVPLLVFVIGGSKLVEWLAWPGRLPALFPRGMEVSKTGKGSVLKGRCNRTKIGF